jgi:hypothetical protein
MPQLWQTNESWKPNQKGVGQGSFKWQPEMTGHN